MKNGFEPEIVAPQPVVSSSDRLSLHGLRRTFLHHLAKVPRLYRGILLLAGHGTIENRLYLQFVRRGYTAFDVGANIGFFTMLFSDLVGPRGSVHSFEPVPPTFAKLNRQVARDSRYRNITTNAFACSDSAGMAEITLPGGDSEQASLRNHAVGTWAIATDFEKFSVPTVRLDDYAAERGLTRLDLLKCDAEGAELPVLKGASGILRKFQPILCLEVSELWIRDFGYAPADIIDFVEQAGYSIFLIDEDRVPASQVRAELATRAASNTVNLLCATPSRADEVKHL